jgi:NAD-dependent deacetylase
MGMDSKIDKMVELLKRSKNTVVVTGAGISTEAGIPDFRGKNGIYRQLGENRVMSIINIDFFRRSPQEFYQFYRQVFHFDPVPPSKAHLVLADMEKKGLIKAIVTQNIDNLHQKAGSKRVIAIHGNADRYVCTNRSCGIVFDRHYVDSSTEVIPYCSQCCSILKPDVVLFGEPIQAFSDAQATILNARVLMVIGSSLTVYPLAGFVKEFSTLTQYLIIINKGYTPMDHAATVKIDTGHTGDLLEAINQRL